MSVKKEVGRDIRCSEQVTTTLGLDVGLPLCPVVGNFKRIHVIIEHSVDTIMC